MLRFRSPTGSIEALPADEARVRALSDAALLAALTREAGCDPFVVAEAIGRGLLVPDRRHGWRLAPRAVA